MSVEYRLLTAANPQSGGHTTILVNEETFQGNGDPAEDYFKPGHTDVRDEGVHTIMGPACEMLEDVMISED